MVEKNPIDVAYDKFIEKEPLPTNDIVIKEYISKMFIYAFSSGVNYTFENIEKEIEKANKEE